MGYEHTQKGPWRFLGYFFALLFVPVIWAASEEPMAVLATSLPSLSQGSRV